MVTLGAPCSRCCVTRGCPRCQETRADYERVDEFFRAGLPKGDPGHQARKDRALDLVRKAQAEGAPPERDPAPTERGLGVVALVGLLLLALAVASVLGYAYLRGQSRTYEREHEYDHGITPILRRDLCELGKLTACEAQVGATEAQKAEWKRIADDFAPRFRVDSPDGNAALRRELREQLRSALREDQRASFDAFCSKLDQGPH